MAAETRDAPGSALLWVAPEWRSERKYHWNRRSITPDAVGVLIADRTRIPFFLEYERRARHPAGVRQKLGPYARYYRSSDIDGDMPPFPITLFVVDSEDVESTYVATAAAMGLSLPILVSSKPALARAGILGRSWRLLWEPGLPQAKVGGTWPDMPFPGSTGGCHGLDETLFPAILSVLSCRRAILDGVLRAGAA